MISSYYSAIAGWTLAYTFEAFSGDFPLFRQRIPRLYSVILWIVHYIPSFTVFGGCSGTEHEYIEAMVKSVII